MKRRQHTAEFRAKVLHHLECTGSVPITAKAWKINPSVIYRWRPKGGWKWQTRINPQEGTLSEPEKQLPPGTHVYNYIRALQAEIGRLHMLLCRKV